MIPGQQNRWATIAWNWWPAAAWALLIFLFSTELFSGQRTGTLLIPLLQKLFPTASISTIFAMHAALRKAAHVVAYFVLSLLVLRGARAGRTGWRWNWALMAWVLASAYAGIDEWHQAHVPSRTGSLSDFLLDSAAAAAAQVVSAVWRFRK